MAWFLASLFGLGCYVVEFLLHPHALAFPLFLIDLGYYDVFLLIFRPILMYLLEQFDILGSQFFPLPQKYRLLKFFL